MDSALLMSMWGKHARRAGLAHDLEPALILAIIAQESGGDRYAWNPEPRYFYLWDVAKNKPFRTLDPGERAAAGGTPPADFPTLAGDRDQEFWGQRASWGLMQIMGAVARELGFGGHYLPALVDPELNLDFSCAHIKRLAGRWGARYGIAGTVAAYNAGTPRLSPAGTFENADYVGKVLKRMDAFKRMESPEYAGN